ncbi:bacteriohemerythrin [Magnetococcus sp. PR-3]|uniref:bacteriohemerythrin n=1 Tax=Magnetococcus sp. PR-3 TaxID=3120355 RepID=UPI002FCE5F96
MGIQTRILVISVLLGTVPALIAAILVGFGQVGWLVLVGLVVSVALGFWVARTICHPIHGIETALIHIADGDFSHRVDEIAGNGEMARIVRHTNAMIENLEQGSLQSGMHAGSITAVATEFVKIRSLIETDANQSSTTVKVVAGENERLAEEVSSVKNSVEDITRNTNAISESATLLSESITSIATASEEASANITTMASAAEEITVNIASVNDNLGQVDSSVKEVASEVSQLTASLNEVRKGCKEASRESEQASALSSENRSVMDRLTASAYEIGKVIQTINDIADQTNMLALNASIEAAGAGEAGKGFAVVANEVKELASQTAEATKVISDQVSTIQENAKNAAQRGEQVGQVIDRTNQLNRDILDSVEQQSMAVDNIAESMKAVAKAAEDVTRSAQELNHAGQDVARAASEAALGTQEIAQSTSQSAQGAQQVAEAGQAAYDFSKTVLDSAMASEQVTMVVKEKMDEASRTALMMQGSAAYFNRLSSALQNTCNALYVGQVEGDTSEPPFDIRDVKDNHLYWMGRLNKAVQRREVLVKDELPDVNKCGLCRWMGSRGSEVFGSVPQFNEAVKSHKEAHKVLLEAYAWQESGAARGGGALMGRYGEQVDKLFRALDQVYIGDKGRAQAQQPFFPWDDRLITGVTFVDRDHKRLVEMVNQLHRGMKEGQGADAIGPILDEFVSYTAEHFAREERVFDKYGYEDTPAHKEKHRKLVATLQQVAQDYKDGSFAVGIDLLGIAKKWLVGHIMGTDMQYVAFFRKHNVNEPPA